jgi:hypothetical protein
MKAISKKSRPWTRRPSEGMLEFNLFIEYIGMGATRNISDVALKSHETLETVQKLATLHRWIDRAKAYDDYIVAIQQSAIERALESEAIKWAHRRSEYREKEYKIGKRLLERVEEMVEAPLYTEVTESEEQYEDGRIKTVTIVRKPNKWSIRDVPIALDSVQKLMRLSMQMETSRQPTESYMQDPAARLERARQVLAKMQADIDTYVADQPELSAEEILQLMPGWVAEDWKVPVEELTSTPQQDTVRLLLGDTTSNEEQEDEESPIN